MKILIINGNRHDGIGGGEKYIRKVINICTSVGFLIEEIYLKYDNKYNGDIKFPSRHITSGVEKISDSFLLFKVLDYKIKMAKINKYLKCNRFDLIIANTPSLSLSKNFCEKCIFIQHEDNQLYEKFAKNFYFKFFNICTIALNSKNMVCYTENSINNFKKIDGEKIRNYYKVNLFVDSFNSIVANPQKIVYLGRVCKEKGLDNLVAVAKLLKEPIHIYGDGPYIAKNKHNVVLHGAVQQRSLIKVFECAKLNVLLSKSEGMGFSIIEGFSYGVPCLLINSSTNSKYLIDKGNNGILCDKNASIIEIANTINNFDSSMFSAKKIKQFCYDNFNVATFIKLWTNILLELSK